MGNEKLGPVVLPQRAAGQAVTYRAKWNDAANPSSYLRSLGGPRATHTTKACRTRLASGRSLRIALQEAYPVTSETQASPDTKSGDGKADPLRAAAGRGQDSG